MKNKLFFFILLAIVIAVGVGFFLVQKNKKINSETKESEKSAILKLPDTIDDAFTKTNKFRNLQNYSTPDFSVDQTNLVRKNPFAPF